VRATASNIAAQTISALAGLALAYAVVAEAWVQFDTIVPMWATAAAVAGLGTGLLVWRPRKFAGLAVGLLASAFGSAVLFTLLSRGPSLD